MSSYYGILFPEFFDGRTGKLLAKHGGVHALLLGAYLTANRYTNMIGLYRLPLDEIKLPMSRSRVRQALDVLDRAGFAHYDQASEFVWVRELARIRVGLPTRAAVLNPGDNRVQFINKLYQSVDDNPFLGAFYDRYAKTLHLNRQRTCEHYPNLSPLERGFQAPPKPVTESGSVPGIRNRDQDQGSGSDQGRAASRKARRDTRTCPNTKTLRVDVLTRLVHAILDEQHVDPLDLPEVVKTRAAKAHIAYDSESIGKAIDSAVAQRKVSA